MGGKDALNARNKSPITWVDMERNLGHFFTIVHSILAMIKDGALVFNNHCCFVIYLSKIDIIRIH